MNAVQAKKLALTEDTMLRAIAPVMRKRAEDRRKADRIVRVNLALKKVGNPPAGGAMKYRICRKCGLQWNVSAIDPGDKIYICPRCERKRERRE